MQLAVHELMDNRVTGEAEKGDFMDRIWWQKCYASNKIGGRIPI